MVILKSENCYTFHKSGGGLEHRDRKIQMNDFAIYIGRQLTKISSLSDDSFSFSFPFLCVCRMSCPSIRFE